MPKKIVSHPLPLPWWVWCHLLSFVHIYCSSFCVSWIPIQYFVILRNKGCIFPRNRLGSWFAFLLSSTVDAHLYGTISNPVFLKFMWNWNPALIVTVALQWGAKVTRNLNLIHGWAKTCSEHLDLLGVTFCTYLNNYFSLFCQLPFRIAQYLPYLKPLARYHTQPNEDLCGSKPLHVSGLQLPVSLLPPA